MLRYIMTALAFILLASPAAATHHIRAYVAPYIPGAARGEYSNAFIVVTNQQPVSAPISIKAYVNGSSTAQSCGTLTDLAPYEIRRFARGGGTLCVARAEPADYSLRIRTIEGVHVSGYLVLAADRNRMLIPMEIARTDPEGPEGISIGSLAVLGTTSGASRVSVRLHSASGHWPYPMQACVQIRTADPNFRDLVNNPPSNCSLPNEQVRGWYPGNITRIVTLEGSHSSEIAHMDMNLNSPGFFSDPVLLRVCINPLQEGGTVSRPILCWIITADGAVVRNVRANTAPDTPESATTGN